MFNMTTKWVPANEIKKGDWTIVVDKKVTVAGIVRNPDTGIIRFELALANGGHHSTVLVENNSLVCTISKDFKVSVAPFPD